jgi:hypothetical protein
MQFPQYRKYKNGEAWFKIISDKEWEEIRITGKNYQLHHFTAKILPDRNFLSDLTNDYYENWVKIEETEYEGMKKRIR